MNDQKPDINIGGQVVSGHKNQVSGQNKVTFGGNSFPQAIPPSTNLGGQMVEGDHNKVEGTNTVEINPPEQHAAATSTVKVLFLFSNSRGTDPLRLHAEQHAIEEALQRSQHRDRIQVRSLPIITTNDLRRALLDNQDCQIVHLAGHSDPAGFELEDDYRKSILVSPEALGEYFQNYQQTLQGVLLNACYTQAIGQCINLGIPNVIAMTGPINDQAAIEFACGFYDALGAGLDIQRAYAEGIGAVYLAGLGQHFRPSFQ